MSDLREMIERVRGELQEYGVYRPRLSPQELDRLLAVAEAACEWVEADDGKELYRAERAIRSAVRGDS